MSIEVRYQACTTHCDYCDNTLPGAADRRDALRKMQRAGWERRRARGEWLDICPDCLFEEKFGDAHERNDGV